MKRALWGVWYVLVVALALSAFATGHPLQGLVYGVVVVVMAVVQLRRRPARAEAVARTTAAPGGWTPSRVDEVLAGVPDDLVQQVRTLRAADPSLTLSDASALVRGRQR